MKKIEEYEKDTSERWMLTYLDLITLLMVFFVLMYAMSNIDSKKYTALSKSLNLALGDGTGYMVGTGSGSAIDTGDTIDGNAGTDDRQVSIQQPADSGNLAILKRDIDKYLHENDLNDYIIAETDERGLSIRLKDSILFDSGKADIKDGSKNTIIKIGKIINKIDGYVRVEGHTDNIPISNTIYKSNWQLSAIRATNVVELLINNSGIMPNKISTVGYGEFRPIADNSSPEGRMKNRRVEIVLMDNKYNDIENKAGQ